MTHRNTAAPALNGNALPVPGPAPETEAARRADLRKHKTIATSLLILATVIYVSMRWLEYQGNPGAWVGYVRAASEAGMVGALADWFAVTALFRHPLRIPIPHTAIIKRKKDQVGHALSEFVGENFLNAALISDKLHKAHIPSRASNWVLNQQGDLRISQEAGKLIDVVINGIDPTEAEQVLRALVIDKASEPQWAPPLGRGLQQLIDEGRTEPAVDAVVVWMDDKARASEDFVTTLIDERTPSWAPRFVRELVGDKVYRELVQFTADVRHNPNHEARQQIRSFIAQLAQDLQHDPAMIAKVEGFKEDIMRSGPVQALPGKLWESVRSNVTAMARDEQALLRRKIAQWSHEFAQRIQDEPQLRDALEDRIVRAASYLADNYAGEVTGIIGETVERWDAQEASDKIELMVGKDLQFIRVNGTIVGALAGLVIYSLTELVFAVA
ncbi:DUF445 family protein [Corynebacterium sp. 320]|uniref:DUF445 domain-containing protein n=1 Tax=Corynebacterium TaxID=1716 RepID=UPI00125CC05F|nr:MULTISPECIES: DUF445 family protein [Corynebacterium]KAB1504446.1 DUF445 family protein [Corynebacterium sp. 320]KAB1552455.1 DUF445 family protein [Corynebacterium sp. 321]KAB1554330.1 DUF445 family protein [Corynebacterium sp. 319]KAB3528582.1 DUF445 family protein [Corynebacterium sp. 250]KAB3539926.1 DUF445 family protein [Corynebacterium sp. 366]